MMNSRAWIFSVVAVTLVATSVIAQNNETCDCSQSDGCDYIQLQCKNGGTFSGSCGEALCPVQQHDPKKSPPEPFAGAGWRAIRPLGDSTPQGILFLFLFMCFLV
jgi:hypothetical protein